MIQRLNLAMALLALSALPAFAEAPSGSVRAGNSLYLDGEYERALEEYQAAQVESPGDDRLMFNIGDANYKLERYDEALSQFLLSAQNASPEVRARSHYNAGNTLYRMGRLEDAVQQYLRALEIDPDDEDAKFNLEFVRREIRRRLNEQQQRQKEQKQQEEERKKQEQARDSGAEGEKQENEQQSKPRQPKEQGAREKGQEAQREQRPEAAESGPSESAGGQKEQAMGQQRMSKENIQRWLDMVEAESAENMKEFLRGQQRGGAVVYPKDW